jgi:hypothetical protein
MRIRTFVALATAAALLGTPFVLHAQSRAALKSARRLLEKLKLVDGAASGLDADTVDGVSPLVVRDASDAVVGVVVQIDAPISVARRIDGRAMTMQVTEAGFVDTNCPILCYEEMDCSGTPYREASDAFLPFVSLCGTTAYYPVGAMTTRAMARCRIPGGSCSLAPSPVDQMATTVATFEVGTLGLVPPFRLDGP